MADVAVMLVVVAVMMAMLAVIVVSASDTQRPCREDTQSQSKEKQNNPNKK